MDPYVHSALKSNKLSTVCLVHTVPSCILFFGNPSFMHLIPFEAIFDLIDFRDVYLFYSDIFFYSIPHLMANNY